MEIKIKLFKATERTLKIQSIEKSLSNFLSLWNEFLSQRTKFTKRFTIELLSLQRKKYRKNKRAKAREDNL